MRKFWSWIKAEAGQKARLVLSGVIESDNSWYEDAVTPAQFARELAEHDGEDIVVEINSPGGDVFAGWEIFNMLIGRQGATGVLITGMAASSASIVAMAADPGELAMCEVSMMMIHNPWTATAGDAEAMRAEAETLELITDVMVSAYMRRFNGTEEELRELMDAETYLTPAQAVEYGLADRVEDFAQGEGEEGESATMLGRYAAMDMGALRARLRVPERALRSPCDPEMQSHGDPEGAHGPLGPATGQQTAPRDYLAEADAIIGRLDKTDGLMPQFFDQK